MEGDCRTAQTDMPIESVANRPESERCEVMWQQNKAGIVDSRSVQLTSGDDRQHHWLCKSADKPSLSKFPSQHQIARWKINYNCHSIRLVLSHIIVINVQLSAALGISA
jgi:hypothetical protein